MRSLKHIITAAGMALAVTLLCAFTLPNFQLTVTPTISAPTIAINGSTTQNQTVAAGGTMTVTASGGPGGAHDFLTICLTGGTCGGATYASDYLNCTQTPPSIPYPTGTPPGGCSFAVPSTPSNAYFLQWQNLDTSVIIATLPFIVGPSGPPAIASIAVSPNSVALGNSFSGSLSVICSAACPGSANYALTTDASVCPSNNNNLFNAISGATLSSAAALNTAGTYYACIAVTMSGVSNSPKNFALAISVTTVSITGVSVNPNTFSVPTGGTATFSGTLAVSCSVSPCPGAATFTLPSNPSPAITVNGSSVGTTVSAGASMTVAVTNGPGNNNDWMGICTTATPSNATCDGAGYQWDFMSCTHTPPSILLTSASCVLTAPAAAGNYQAVFFWCNYPSNCPNGGYNVLTTAAFTVTGGGGGGACTSSVGGPTPTPCPVGVAAPSGQHWNLTFYDNFRTDSSINGSLWTQNNTAGSVITCCDSFYGIRSYPHLDLGNLGYTWTDLTMNSRQRYGFFELGFRWPTDASGEGDGRHIDINVNVGPGGCGAACSELDISEQELGTGAQYLDNTFMHDCDAPHSSDPACGGQVGTAQWALWSPADGLKMSDHNRALGMQWTNDGTAHGTVQVFVDGSAVTGTHSLVSSAFDLGIRWDIFDVACEGSSWGNGSAACNAGTSSPGTNPLSIQYVATWQLAPN